MNLKVCSVIWKSFKDGMQWLNGDFNASQDLHQTEDLKMLQDTFVKNNDITSMTSQQLGMAIETFLHDAGYVVAFNDYTDSIDESLSENEAKKFIKLLRSKKEVKFKYKKVKDSSVRKARGTLDPETIRKGLTASDIDKARKRRNIPDSIVIYWDLDKDMFRCFKKALFIGYI